MYVCGGGGRGREERYKERLRAREKREEVEQFVVILANIVCSGKPRSYAAILWVILSLEVIIVPDPGRVTHPSKNDAWRVDVGWAMERRYKEE